jgi:hypothetical protein
MTALEGTTVHPTSEIVALDDEFGAEFPGAFAVAEGWRSEDKPSFYDVVKSVEKLVGNPTGAHGSLYQGGKMRTMAKGTRYYPILKRWCSHRNARGDQAYYENALPTMIVLSEGIVESLIQALVEANKGKTNKLYIAIQKVASNINVMAQCAVAAALFTEVMGPYRAAQRLNQADGAEIVQEIHALILSIIEGPEMSLRLLLFPTGPVGRGSRPVPLVNFPTRFKLEKNWLHHEHLFYAAAPPPLRAHGATLLTAFDKLTAGYLKTWCKGCRHRMEVQAGEGYGNMMRLNARLAAPATMGPNTIDALNADKARHVASTSLGVEGNYAKQDNYMRSEIGKNKSELRVHAWLAVGDVDLEEVLLQFDDEELDKMILTALWFCKHVLEPRWNKRMKDGEAAVKKRLERLLKETIRKKAARVQYLADLALLAKTPFLFPLSLGGDCPCCYVRLRVAFFGWHCAARISGISEQSSKMTLKDIDAAGLNAEKVVKDYLGERLKMYHEVHKLHSSLVPTPIQEVFIPAGATTKRVCYYRHNGVDLSMTELANNVIKCAMWLKLGTVWDPPRSVPLVDLDMERFKRLTEQSVELWYGASGAQRGKKRGRDAPAGGTSGDSPARSKSKSTPADGDEGPC